MSPMAAVASAQGLPRELLLAAIRAYQRHVSPYKGFACAWRVETGRCSCSRFGYRAVARHGAWRGLGLLRRRLDRCGEAFERRRHAAARGQRGVIDCDLPCDVSCRDAPSCDGACELLNCVDCGDCGWGRRRRASGERPRRC